jgi:hypothetical protein
MQVPVLVCKKCNFVMPLPFNPKGELVYGPKDDTAVCCTGCVDKPMSIPRRPLVAGSQSTKQYSTKLNISATSGAIEVPRMERSLATSMVTQQ